jgi:hypothetical protein
MASASAHPVDPTSFANCDCVRVVRMHLDWSLDFAAHTIAGTVVLHGRVVAAGGADSLVRREGKHAAADSFATGDATRLDSTRLRYRLDCDSTAT